MSRRARAYLALTIMAIVWGAALPLVKPALDFITPIQFLYFRYLIAAPLMLPVLIYYAGKTSYKFRIYLKIIALEFLSTVILLPILYQGLKLTSGLEASLIGATGPIITVIGGIIFLHEREEKREWQGLVLSFLGTLILIIEPLLTGRSQSATFSFTGNLLIISYNLLYTAYALLAKKTYQHLPKLFISSLGYPVALIGLGAMMYFSGQSASLTLLSIPSVSLASFYMAIFGSIIGLTLFLYGQNLIEASEASLFTYLQGVVAIPVAWFFLKEKVSPLILLAIIIISLGVYLAEYRPKGYNRKS